MNEGNRALIVAEAKSAFAKTRNWKASKLVKPPSILFPFHLGNLPVFDNPWKISWT